MLATTDNNGIPLPLRQQRLMLLAWTVCHYFPEQVAALESGLAAACPKAFALLDDFIACHPIAEGQPIDQSFMSELSAQLYEYAFRREWNGHTGKNTVALAYSDLDLSVRSWNALDRHGIRTVEALTAHTPRQLLRIKNLGKVSLHKIIKELARHSLELAPESMDRPGYPCCPGC